jgi:Protein of unknown function (DUF1579)
MSFRFIPSRASALLAALGAAMSALTVSADTAAAATPPGDAFLTQLVGEWDMSGTVNGRPVRYRGEGRWVLKNSWLCLTMTDSASPPAYQASVFLGFDRRAGDYIAHWLDQLGAAGARVVASGKREGRTLVLLFPYSDGAFRDTLSLAANGASGSLLLESQQKDGHWSTFASYRLTRP